VYYLVRFKVHQPADVEDVADREDVYVAPEGDRGWTVLEVEDEEDLRRTVEGQDVEEVQPVLLAREYVAISSARRELEDSKARFVDDPSGALEEARQAVGRALEARGYPSSERTPCQSVRTRPPGPARRSSGSTRPPTRRASGVWRTLGVPSTAYQTC